MKNMTRITLDNLKSSPALCGDFNKIREEVIREVGENQNEVDRRLTEMILPNFIISVHMEKNREQYLKKKKKKTEQYLEKKKKKYLEKKRKKYLEKPLEKKREKYLEKKLDQYLEWKGKRYLNKALEKKKKRGPKKQFDSENINKNQEKEEDYSCKPKKQRKNPLEKEESVVSRILPLKKRPLDQNQEIEEEEEGNSRKPKRQRKNPIKIKPMPTKFMDKIKAMQGSDIKPVIQKELTSSDVQPSLDRLLIPSGQMMRPEFLSEEEQDRITKKEADKHFKGMEVALIEPGLQESTIFLKKWKVGKTYSYVLSKPWIEVKERNKLKSGDAIQLWSFRVNQSIHFALIKLDN